MTPQLHGYQELAVDFLRNRGRAALMMDMGLGKTAAALTALTPEHMPVLVVAPKRVAEHVWPAETAIWRPDLTISVAAGEPKDRARGLLTPADITVIGRDNIREAAFHSKRAGWRTLILDEMSSFKTKMTNRWREANRLAKRLTYVWGLTGTPTPNGLIDLWAQIYLLDQGRRLGPTLGAYRGRYFMPGRQLGPSPYSVEWLIRDESDQVIHQLIEDICLSISGEGLLDLPPVTFNTVEVSLPPRSREQYRTLKKDLVLDLELLGGEIHTAANSAVLSAKLSQVAAGFIYSDEMDGSYTVLHKAKVDAVREIVDNTSSPIIVFNRFRAEAEMLYDAFPQMESIDRKGVIDDWNRGSVPLLLAHPASVGHGLNLQHGGHTAIWSSLTWSLEEWLQANKRLDRQGQTHPVMIHVLQADGTVDPVIRDALDGKRDVQEALLYHVRSPM